jgi:hypothetical protein
MTTNGDVPHQQRSNDTHESKTDDGAQLYGKGKTTTELRLMGHTRIAEGYAVMDVWFSTIIAGYIQPFITQPDAIRTRLKSDTAQKGSHKSWVQS